MLFEYFADDMDRDVLGRDLHRGRHGADDRGRLLLAVHCFQNTEVINKTTVTTTSPQRGDFKACCAAIVYVRLTGVENLE